MDATEPKGEPEIVPRALPQDEGKDGEVAVVGTNSEATTCASSVTPAVGPPPEPSISSSPSSISLGGSFADVRDPPRTPQPLHGQTLELGLPAREPLLKEPIPCTMPAVPSSSPGVAGLSFAAQRHMALPDDAECRLCFERGDEPLITPCNCSGTSAWVHRGCLNQWRYHAQPTNMKAMTHCPTCAFEYRLICTFDVNDTQQQKRKYCLRVLRDSIFAFLAVQVVMFLLAVLIREFDSGEIIANFFSAVRDSEWTIEHPWTDFLKHHIFHYYCAAVLIVLFILGCVGLVFMCISCCCPDVLPRSQVRQINYGRREGVVDDCCRSCYCYDPIVPQGNLCCPCCECGAVDGSDLSCAACTCEGEAALIFLVVVVVAVIVLGAFVAMFMFSMWIQRLGQRYLKALHLKDVTERFAVADRSGEDLPRVGGVGELPQEEIRKMLQAEIRATRGVVQDAPVPEEEDAANAGGIA